MSWKRPFCAGLISRRDFFRRAALIVGGTAAAFELLGRVSPRRAAWASPGITLDPTVDPLAQGYETDGDADYATGARLVFNDTSTQRHRTFFVAEPTIANSIVSVDVTVQVLETGLTLAGGLDTGARILSEGQGGVEIGATLIDRGTGGRRVALLTGTGGFTQGVPFDWTIEGTFRITRDPDPNNRATLTVPGQASEVLADADLPAAHRLNPSFEFGCASDAATAIAFFGRIGMPSSFPMTITPAHVVLIPNRIEGVALNGSFELDPASNGIDPVNEGVTLELSTPGGTFYPAGDDVMPVGMRTVRGGWSITDAERTRTGIDFFVIQRTANPRRFQYVLLDGRSDLPAGNYSQVSLDLAIGDDQGGVAWI
ncbi:MAG: hypothetical protein ACREQ2_05205 [Candidatus Binatia bacterium]